MSVTMATLERQRVELSRDIATLKPTRPVPSAFDMAALAGITPDPWQERMLSSDKRQFPSLASRQSGKGMTSALLALHEAIYHPGSLALVVASTERQSKLLLKSIRSFSHQLKDAPVALSNGKIALRRSN